MKNIFDNLKNVFVIAELSANHNGSLEIAIETIKAAKRAGADAIKLQTYRPDTITIDSKKKDFIIEKSSLWANKTLYKLYSEAYTPWEWHEKLFNVAMDEGLICFSTPFDKTAVDLLESLNNPIYKIASFEITDIPLIEYIASKNKPIIISTGIAKRKDIELALKTIRKVGTNEVALLKCTSSYPAPLEEANLKMIPFFSKKFNLVTGLSDHTLGYIAPIVAVTLGAKIIEKHFILNKEIGGPDSEFSLDEKEFKEMVDKIRQAEKLIGECTFKLTKGQINGRKFKRSIYVFKNIKKGERFSENNVKSVRPGFGLHPKFFNKILGKKSHKNYLIGDRLDKDILNNLDD